MKAVDNFWFSLISVADLFNFEHLFIDQERNLLSILVVLVRKLKVLLKNHLISLTNIRRWYEFIADDRTNPAMDRVFHCLIIDQAQPSLLRQISVKCVFFYSAKFIF